MKKNFLPSHNPDQARSQQEASQVMFARQIPVGWRYPAGSVRRCSLPSARAEKPERERRFPKLAIPDFRRIAGRLRLRRIFLKMVSSLPTPIFAAGARERQLPAGWFQPEQESSKVSYKYS